MSTTFFKNIKNCNFIVQIIIAALLVLGLAGCGGGGGGGGGSNFSIETSQVSFTSTENGFTPATQFVTGRITNVNQTVYLFVQHTDVGISRASVSITGQNSGKLSIFPRSPSQLSPGTYTDSITIFACLDSQCNKEISGSPKTISVTHTVNPETAIISSSNSLLFTAVEGQASSSQLLSLSSNTGQMPTWSHQVIYTSGSNWLTVNKNTINNTLEVNVLPLTVGSYSAIVRIRYSVNGTSKQKDIAISYTATTISNISLNSVLFNTTEGDSPTPQIIAVDFNTATQPSWTATATYSSGTNWLTITPSANAISIQTDLLAPGNYQATLHIQYSTGSLGISTLNIPVRYNISNGVTLSESSLIIDAIEGSVPSSIPVDINYSGTGNLSWSTSINYQSGSSWLTVTPSSGSSLPDSFDVSVAPLAEGTYNATIDVSYSFGNVTSKRSIPVTYNISNGVTLSKTALTIDAIEGSVPSSIPVDINYSGTGNLSWSTSINYQNGSDWLTVTPSSGNSLPDSFTVSAGALPKGSYNATIDVNYSFSGVTSKISLPVNYNTSKGVTLSASALTIDAMEGEVPSSMPVDINYTGTGNISWTTSINYQNGSDWLTVTPSSGNSLPDSFTVSAGALPKGSYNATIDVNYSIAGVTSSIALPVSYTTSSAWSAPNQVDFVLDNSATLDNFQNTITILDTYTDSSDLNWSASISEPWITLPTTSGDTASNNQVVLSLVNSEVGKLTNGMHSATLTLVSDDPNVAAINIPVNLSLNLPVVNYISTYVEYVDTVGSDYKIIRGKGFSGLTQNVMFGTLPAVSINVVSDTEIHATPPVLTEGNYNVFVENILGLELTQAQLVVKTPPNFADSYTAANIESLNRIIYDEEREVLYVVQCYYCPESGGVSQATIYRFSYNNGWAVTSHSFPGLIDIALTPNGRELLVYVTNQLLHVNPDTMATNKVVDLPFSLSGYFRDMSVLNDGLVLFISELSTYSLIDESFDQFSLSEETKGIVTSPDGSRAFTGYSNNPFYTPFRYYDASTNLWTETTTLDTFVAESSMDRHATRLFLLNKLYDENGTLIGYLPGLTHSYFGTISHDGTKIYSFNIITKQIDIVDISGLPPYDISTSITIPDLGTPKMTISQNGNILFLISQNGLLVENLTPDQ